MPVHDVHEGADRTLHLLRSPIIHKSSVGRSLDQTSLDPSSASDLESLRPTGEKAARREQKAIDELKFHRHEEATHAELFYDLFFVANLTVFTYVHHVNDAWTLKQYVGFFSLLWLTWYQNSLYDIRFSMDSVFERVAKFCHFAVMIAFAVISVNYKVGETEEQLGTDAYQDLMYICRGLSLVLMVDRLVLALQYLQTMWFTRGTRRAVFPLGLIVLTYFTAAMIYLGVSFAFTDTERDRDMIFAVWYTVALLEAITATVISSIWKVISFRGTHLIERMGLLTLIILGEGIIALAKECQFISKYETAEFTPSVIAFILCALLNLYFVYMLYFDWQPESKMGEVKEQIWSASHFLLHVALVLAVEGMAQCIAWRGAIVNTISSYSLYFHDHLSNTTISAARPASYWDGLAFSLNVTVDKYSKDLIEGASGMENVEQVLRTLSDSRQAVLAVSQGNPAVVGSVERAQVAALWLFSSFQANAIQVAGFKTSVSNDTTVYDFNNTASIVASVQDNTDFIYELLSVFKLTFTYFFATIGAVVIIIAFLGHLTRNHRQRTVGDVARLVITVLIGLGLSLISTMASVGLERDADYSPPLYAFVSSAWILPIVTLALFTVIVVNNIPFPKHKKPIVEVLPSIRHSSRDVSRHDSQDTSRHDSRNSSQHNSRSSSRYSSNRI